MPIDMIIRATGKFTSKGAVYETILGDEIIASGISPEFPSCRKLKERGHKGMVRFWRDGKDHYDFKIGIEWGAEHYVTESAKVGPRFSKWAPNPLFSKDNSDE